MIKRIKEFLKKLFRSTNNPGPRNGCGCDDCGCGR